MDFSRRLYEVKDAQGRPVSDLKARVTIDIGGKVHTQVELRAPGLIAVVCSPEAPDVFAIEIVEKGGKRFTDMRLPAEAGDVLPWQREALKI